MSRLLPPLSAIRVFEAAARHGSFTRAAAELGMTQSAVSYQIKVLEERVGAPLFIRRARDVVLSDAGHALAPATHDAFDRLAAAFSAARGASEGVLTLSVQPTFAAQWLAERLGSFQVAHPRLAVRLDVTNKLSDLARDDVDVAIRSGPGGWPGLEQHRLLPCTFTPMLSPSLAERFGPITEPADMLRLPRISAADVWWDDWFAAAGLSVSRTADDAPGSDLGTQHIEGRAALAGHGVGMLTPVFFKDELAAGRLLQPFELVASNGHSYWLCYPASRRTTPKIRAFRDWILAEIAEDRPAA